VRYFSGGDVTFHSKLQVPVLVLHRGLVLVEFNSLEAFANASEDSFR
jgi:hypothetical protein